MTLCDFCFKTDATVAARDLPGRPDACEECDRKIRQRFDEVMLAMRETNARKACSSLTPDQAAKVEAFYAS